MFILFEDYKREIMIFKQNLDIGIFVQEEYEIQIINVVDTA